MGLKQKKEKMRRKILTGNKAFILIKQSNEAEK